MASMGISGGSDWERRLADLEAAVAANRADLDALQHRALQADDRADQGDARSAAQDARMDSLEAQSVLDRKVIAQLQADGLVSDEHAAHLQRALSTSRRIGAAIGIVMFARQVGEGDAFELLCTASQHSNRRLSVLADEIVTKGDVNGLLDP